MKAIVLLSRAGQIIILAIAFMACIGWNQASGLQNNISAISQKRIKDIVRVRYVLPYTNLHTVRQYCSPDAAFDSQNHTNNLNNLSIWNSQENPARRDAQSCGIFRSVSSKQTKTDSALFSVPVFCQSMLSIADVFHGQGYFSGFENSSAAEQAATEPEEDIDDISVSLGPGMTVIDINNLNNDANRYPGDGVTSVKSSGRTPGCPTK